MRLLTLFLLCSLLQNCRPTETYDKDITYIRAEDVKEVEDFNPLDLMDSCTYIRLETGDEVLLGSVQQVKMTKERIYVSDLNNNDLSVFDRQGKFLHKIGSQGRGPQEYQWLVSFTLTPTEDTVILYDGGNHRLQFYTPDNQYLHSLNLYRHMHRDSNVFRHISNIHALQGGRLLVHYTYMHLCPVNYSLYDYGRDTLLDVGYMPFSMAMPQANDAFDTSDPVLTQYEDTTSCCIEFNDTIFRLAGHALRPRIVVLAMKERMLSDKVLRQQDGKEAVDIIRQLFGKRTCITDIQETKDYFFITYLDRNIVQELIWNKRQGKGILVPAYDFYAYRYDKPHALTMSEVFDEENDSPLLHTPDLDRLRPLLSEDDNPLIVIYHPKYVEF